MEETATLLTGAGSSLRKLLPSTTARATKSATRGLVSTCARMRVHGRRNINDLLWKTEWKPDAINDELYKTVANKYKESAVLCGKGDYKDYLAKLKELPFPHFIKDSVMD